MDGSECWNYDHFALDVFITAIEQVNQKGKNNINLGSNLQEKGR